MSSRLPPCACQQTLISAVVNQSSHHVPVYRGTSTNPDASCFTPFAANTVFDEDDDSDNGSDCDCCSNDSDSECDFQIVCPDDSLPQLNTYTHSTDDGCVTTVVAEQYSYSIVVNIDDNCDRITSNCLNLAFAKRNQNVCRPTNTCEDTEISVQAPPPVTIMDLIMNLSAASLDVCFTPPCNNSIMLNQCAQLIKPAFAMRTTECASCAPIQAPCSCKQEVSTSRRWRFQLNINSATPLNFRCHNIVAYDCSGNAVACGPIKVKNHSH